MNAMMGTFVAVAAGALLQCAEVPSLAMDTDDPGTIAPECVQVEIGLERSACAGGSENSLGIAATTGILPNLDIGVALPWLILDPDGGSGASGLADLEAGLKWRFLDADGLRPALALTAGVTVPTGDEEKGLGGGAYDVSAALIAGFAIEPFGLYLNLGYTQIGGADRGAGEREGVVSASAALDWAIAEPLALNAELLYESAGADGESAALAATAGAAYAISDAVCLDGGARLGLSETAPDWGLFATLTVAVDVR